MAFPGFSSQTIVFKSSDISFASVLHLPRGVVADVHEEILAERTFTAGTMAHPASYQVRRCPRDLSVVTDLVQIVRLVVAEFVVFVFHVPHSDGEVPVSTITKI